MFHYVPRQKRFASRSWLSAQISSFQSEKKVQNARKITLHNSCTIHNNNTNNTNVLKQTFVSFWQQVRSDDPPHVLRIFSLCLSFLGRGLLMFPIGIWKGANDRNFKLGVFPTSSLSLFRKRKALKTATDQQLRAKELFLNAFKGLRAYRFWWSAENAFAFKINPNSDPHSSSRSLHTTTRNALLRTRIKDKNHSLKNGH